MNYFPYLPSISSDDSWYSVGPSVLFLKNVIENSNSSSLETAILTGYFPKLKYVK